MQATDEFLKCSAVIMQLYHTQDVLFVHYYNVGPIHESAITQAVTVSPVSSVIHIRVQ